MGVNADANETKRRGSGLFIERPLPLFEEPSLAAFLIMAGNGRREGSRADASFRQGINCLEGRRASAWLCSCIHGCRRAVLSCVCTFVMALTAEASFRQGIKHLFTGLVKLTELVSCISVSDLSLFGLRLIKHQLRLDHLQHSV